MSSDPAATASSHRALSGLTPRRTVNADPAVSRLRRDHRAAPANPMQSVANEGQLDRAVLPTVPSERPEPPEHVGQRTVTPEPAPEPSGLPKYLRLVRKEARVREDQFNQLTQLTRQINKARRRQHGVVGERITENTLIRVAIDLLLEHCERLTGVTEEELRHAVCQRRAQEQSRSELPN
jgi:hypothetical protein